MLSLFVFRSFILIQVSWDNDRFLRCRQTMVGVVLFSDSSAMSPRRSGLVGSPVGSSRLECSPLLLLDSASGAVTTSLLTIDSSGSMEVSGVAGVASFLGVELVDLAPLVLAMISSNLFC